MCRISVCCYCCDLETGTKIIGYIESIMLLGFIASYSIVFVIADLSKYSDLFFGTLIARLIIYCVQFIASLMLLYGASKRRPNWLKPWLAADILGILASILSMVAMFVVYASNDESIAIATTLTSAVFGIFLEIYFVIVIYSYYKELKVPTIV